MSQNFIEVRGVRHPIYISSGALSSTMSVDDMIPRLKDQGIYNLELASGARFECFENIKSAAGIMNFMIHNYFPVPAIPSVLNTALDEPTTHDFVARSMAFANAVKAEIYSVHAGYVTRFKASELGNIKAQRRLEKITQEEFWESYDRFVAVVKKILKQGENKGLTVFFENNGISSQSLVPGDEAPRSHLVRAQDFQRLNVDVPKIKLLYDVAHAKISANAFSEDKETHFEAYSNAIAGLHLSDNDGITDTNDPFHEESWFFPQLRELLSKALQPIPIVIEVYDLTIVEIKEQVNILTKQLR